MNAVLLGYGTVGKGVEKLCQSTPGIDLKQVFVLPEFEDLPYFSNNGLEMVKRPDVDIVFECLSGTEPSTTLIKEALKAGKHVISSNKATIAPKLEEFDRLAKENGGSIQIEASVAGGIPFLDALLKLSALEPIRGYEGIFNGTSNYILDRMQKEGLKFEDVLKEAQKLGYAEADPANDVEGTDVWYKTKIANMLAYHTKDGGLHKPLGISKLTENDVRMAKKYGRTIRHISRSTSDGKTYASIIAPAFLKEDNYLASVPSNYNAQLIFADSFDKLGYFGQGAGQMATAQAMLADALDTLSGRRRELDFSKELKENPALLTSKWLIRTNADIPAELVEKKEDGYVWTKPAGITFVDEILAQDPNAMAALWD